MNVSFFIHYRRAFVNTKYIIASYFCHNPDRFMRMNTKASGLNGQAHDKDFANLRGERDPALSYEKYRSINAVRALRYESI